MSERYEEWRRWAEFEHRDGFLSGFVVGLLAATVMCVVVFAAVAVAAG